MAGIMDFLDEEMLARIVQLMQSNPQFAAMVSGGGPKGSAGGEVVPSGGTSRRPVTPPGGNVAVQPPGQVKQSGGPATGIGQAPIDFTDPFNDPNIIRLDPGEAPGVRPPEGAGTWYQPGEPLLPRPIRPPEGAGTWYQPPVAPLPQRGVDDYGQPQIIDNPLPTMTRPKLPRPEPVRSLLPETTNAPPPRDRLQSGTNSFRR